MKGKWGMEGWGGRENSYHGDYDITKKGLCALPQWEFCLCGGEGEQQSRERQEEALCEI